MRDWSPKQIVEELNRYIIGQNDAKRDVAIALRNRYRRSRLPREMQEEITPKNIIMIGPTGVGKTEIARRLAKLVEAPFIKVEATKFTEVGYVGRDVDSMVRDLAEASVRMVQAEKQKKIQAQAEKYAEARLVGLILPVKKKEARAQQNPLDALFGRDNHPQEEALTEEEKQVYKNKREEVEQQLKEGKLEGTVVEIEVVEQAKVGMDFGGMGMEIGIGDMLGGLLPKKTKKRKLPVSEARKVLIQEEADKLVDMDEVTREALARAEQEGIIFLDEIDKIAGKHMGSGPDVSREGVQRDILPIVEGCTVTTKYGPVKTDFMLFVAAGAFHIAKVSDLIPELQGRFPIKVTLDSLSAEDFKRILTQPENAIVKQYAALLETDNIHIVFKDEAIAAIAEHAFAANETSENIGARRLHTIMEALLQDISFNANGRHPMTDVVIDAQYVAEHLGEDMHVKSLNKYIL